MLRVRHLTCGYGGDPVVRDVSFTVEEGEHLCILGPNGCGKTTLLRALAGILPFRGQAELDGTDLSALSPRARARLLALMPQLAPAAFSYTVYETVSLGRYARSRPGLPAGETEEDRRAVRESMERCGVWDLRERLVTRLSGGQLQRVFLARTFAQEPRVIVLDEPTSHLDLRYQLELLRSLREWSRGGGRCVVAVLHDLNLALDFADRLLLLEEGRVLDTQRPGELDCTLLSRLYGLDVRSHMQALLRRWEAMPDG